VLGDTVVAEGMANLAEAILPKAKKTTSGDEIVVEIVTYPTLIIKSQKVQFGTAKVGGLQSRKVTINGQIPFRILSVQSSGGSLSADWGEEAAKVQTLTVHYHPKQAGALKAELIVTTDQGKDATITIAVQGQAVP